MRPKGGLQVDRISFTYDNFLFSEELHDVVFQFEGSKEKIPAHSQILAFVSEVFRTQFFGSLPQKTIKIEDASIDNFRVFLRCIYTGELQVTLKNMFELAYLANKYMIPQVTTKVATYFKSQITTNKEVKLWKLFNPEMIALFDDEGKSNLSLLLASFEKNPLKYLNCEEFLLVDKDAVRELVRTNLAVREADLFTAVSRWATHQCVRKKVKPTEANLRKQIEDFIHELRLPTLGNELVYKLRLHSIPLLLPEEKAGLASYCAGLISQPIPFRKLPRLRSLDVLVCTAACAGALCFPKCITSSFVPQANYRFVGLSCALNLLPTSDGTPGPAQIKFELRSSSEFHVNCKGYDIVCTFERKVNSVRGVKQYEVHVTCRPGDIIPLVAGRHYALIMRPSGGISVKSFYGDFKVFNSSMDRHLSLSQVRIAYLDRPFGELLSEYT